MKQQKTARFDVSNEVRVRNVGFFRKLFFRKEERWLLGKICYIIGVSRGRYSDDFLYTVACQDESGLKAGCFFENELEDTGPF